MECFDTIIIFPSLSELMEAELLLLGEAHRYRIEPVPTHLTTECGMCIAIRQEDLAVIQAQLDGQDIEYGVEGRNRN